MEQVEFELKGEYIELNKLLKVLALVATGGEAGMVIQDGLVSVDGQRATEKRKKIRKGNTVEFESFKISVV